MFCKKKFFSFSFFFCLMFLVFCGVSILKSEESKKPNTDNIASKYLNDLMEAAKKKIDAGKALLSKKGFKKAMSKIDYTTDSKIKFFTSEGDGFLVDKGYIGAGDVTTSFEGLQVKIVISGELGKWEPVIEKFLKAFGGPKFEKFLKFSPAQEFIFNLILLLKNKFDKKISVNEFFMELNLLFLRLLNNPDYSESLKALLSDVSPFFVKIFEAIKIKDKGIDTDVLSYLQKYYENFRKMLNRPFPMILVKGEYKENKEYKVADEGKKDDKSGGGKQVDKFGPKLNSGQASGLLFAILIRAMRDYYQIKSDFEKDKKNKDFLAKQKKSLEALEKIENLDEKIKKRKEIKDEYENVLKTLPVYKDLKGKFLIPELARLYARLEGSQGKNLVEKLANAFLKEMGLDLKTILKAIEAANVEPKPPVEELPPGFDINPTEYEFADLD